MAAFLALPEMDRTSYMQLLVLLLVLPVQFILTDWLGSPEYQRSDSIRRFVTSAREACEQGWLDMSELRRRVRAWVFSEALRMPDYKDPTPPPDPKKTSRTGTTSSSEGEVPGAGLLGASLQVHSPRDLQVQFRVGQVVRHKIFNYRAVVIGWDERPKAPADWFRGVVPVGKMAAYTNQPFYAVLIDTRDRAPQTTYIPQANLELLGHTKVIHPSLDEYFEGFDWQQYAFSMRPWLKRIYPHDGP